MTELNELMPGAMSAAELPSAHRVHIHSQNLRGPLISGVIPSDKEIAAQSVYPCVAPQVSGSRSDYFMYPLGLAVWLLTGLGRLSPAGQAASPGSGLVACGAAPAG